jgi:hypothetical protein
VRDLDETFRPLLIDEHKGREWQSPNDVDVVIVQETIYTPKVTAQGEIYDPKHNLHGLGSGEKVVCTDEENTARVEGPSLKLNKAAPSVFS